MRYMVLILALAISCATPQDGLLWTADHTNTVRTQLHDSDPVKSAAAQHELHRHGWDLLKLVTGQKSSHPSWYWDWCTADTVYSSAPCPDPGKKTTQLRSQIESPDRLPAIETILSSAYYNPAMAAYLRKPLASAFPPKESATLAGVQLAGPGVPGDAMKAVAKAFQEVQGPGWTGVLPEMPAGAIIVKPGWYHLSCPRAGEAFPSVGVYQGEDGWDPSSTNNRFKISPRTLDYAPYCKVPGDMKRLDDTGMMKLDDFFYFRSKAGSNFQVEGVKDGLILEGDYLLLMGLHVITHEQKDWVWTTFWWSPKPADDDAKPDWAQKDEKFCHLNMRITVEFREDQGQEPVFNPYLEATTKGGAKAHCIACHRNAMVKVTGTGTPSAQLTAPVPKMEDWKTLPDCKGSVCTSFIWSVARRAFLFQVK